MFREAIGKGETVVLAKEEACRKLGTDNHDVEFEVLQAPVKKVFGLFGGKQAKVRAIMKVSPAVRAKKYIEDIVRLMGLKGICMTVEEKEKEALFHMEGEDIGFLIGRRGETLTALQYLAGLVANSNQENYYKVIVNTADYRDKRERTLTNLGRKMAFQAVKTKKTLKLEPMNPYERRIIHAAVQKVRGATSWSEGENQQRHVIIASTWSGRSPKKTSYREIRKVDDHTSKKSMMDLSEKKTPLYGKVEPKSK